MRKRLPDANDWIDEARVRLEVLTTILLHTSVNVPSRFIPLTNAPLIVDAVIALPVILDIRMWRKPIVESPVYFAEEYLFA